MKFLCQGTDIEVRAMLECIAEGCGTVVKESESQAKPKTTYGKLFQNTVQKNQMGIPITIEYSKNSGTMRLCTATFMPDDLLSRMHRCPYLRDMVKFPVHGSRKAGLCKTDVNSHFPKGREEKYFKAVGNLLDVGVETLKPRLQKHFQEMMRTEFDAIGENDEEVEEVGENPLEDEMFGPSNPVGSRSSASGGRSNAAKRQR